MNRSPLIKPRLSSPKQPNRVPTAPLKSRGKAPINLTDSLGLDKDAIFNLAQRIKEHPLKDYSAVKDKQKVEVITLPKTANKYIPKRQPISETYDQQIPEQKRPQTSKGTRRAKQADSEYHEQQPQDLILFNHQLGQQKQPRKKPTTRIIFSAHTKRPKVVHLDELITRNTRSVRKPVVLPFETSMDPEFLSLFANKH